MLFRCHVCFLSVVHMIIIMMCLWKVSSECSSSWCQHPDGAGGTDCWAGWAGEKCLCEFNKVGSPNLQTYPKMTGNVKERTGTHSRTVNICTFPRRT